MITETHTLPAYWASTLVNGDWFGLSDTETGEIRDWLNEHPHLGDCLIVSDEYIYHYWGERMMCADYVFPVVNVPNDCRRDTMRQAKTERRHPAGLGGIQKLYEFDNGYGASVVQAPFSYGGSEGLWELGVLRWQEGKFTLTYDTAITDDVVGYLTEAAVEDLLARIEALPDAAQS